MTKKVAPKVLPKKFVVSAKGKKIEKIDASIQKSKK